MLLFILCNLLAPSPALAEGPIRVRANTHRPVFGQQITYHLEVTSDAPIQSIHLTYRTSDTRGMTVEAMAFDQDTSVSVDYTHDIGIRYIRPFVDIMYSWTIVDTAGAKLTTGWQMFAYADDRFDWQTLVGDTISVHWYQGSLKVAQQALNVATAGLDRARYDIHVDAMRKLIDVYLYASAADLGLALPAGLPAGAGALTLYETNVVLAPFGPEEANIPHLKRILPHEVTHALIHEVTQSDFDHVPLWLSEGMATSVEHTFVPDPNAQTLLEEALDKRETIPLNTLCATFPRDLESAHLAYAESASVVNYVRDMYGRQALRDLVAAYADGATCEGGVQRVLGFSLNRLETLWRESLAPRSRWTAFWEDSGAWAILLMCFLALPFLFIGASRIASYVSQPAVKNKGQ